jgi:hypothetical protein
MALLELSASEIESLLGERPRTPPHAVALALRIDEELMQQHLTSGFVMEDSLLCVLGDFVGNLGEMRIRQCSANGLHLCRNMPTAFMSGGNITVRQPLYSIQHLRLDMSSP